MKLNKIILSLLLVCSFSYGATIKDIINNSEKEKKDNLEKLKRIKNPDSLLNEFDFDYKKYLNNEISITRLLAIRLANRSEKHGTTLGYDYTTDRNGRKEIDIVDTWQDFLEQNKNIDYKKIRARFVNSIFGVYTNGYKDKEFRKVSTHKDFNNEGYYYLIVGYATKIDENGVLINISLSELRHKVLEGTDTSTVDIRILDYPAEEVYIENLPKDTSTYIKNYLNDYHKQYPLVSFIVKGNGLYDKNIPKGIYTSGKAYNSHRPYP